MLRPRGPIGARLDFHDEYGTFFSPRVAALLRSGEWTSRVSVGQGFFASTPLTEETEAAGLSRLTVDGDLDAERGTSVSADLTRRLGPLSITGTFFASRVTDAVGTEREEDYRLFTRPEPSTNIGAEALVTKGYILAGDRKAVERAAATVSAIDEREARLIQSLGDRLGG